MALILLVEDESDFSNLVRKSLEAEGHQVLQAFTGPDGLTLAMSNRPDLIILDWMLPGMDGLTVCRTLRQTLLTPILMMTARSDEIDRVLGLEVGADDYLVKPVSLRELTARVRATLRRVEMDSRGFNNPSAPGTTAFTNESSSKAAASVATHDAVIEIGELRLLPEERQVFIAGEELELTPKEYELLKLMASNPGRAFSREYLLENIWGYEYDGFDRTVDTHILRLRKKLGSLGDRVSTVWGVGYRFAREG
ncbi:MAG TPA: response regulator transcription factor [Chloroflexia bacterium]|nr:response regulator transcription factor [Chloroflexia bacterium]